MTAAKAPYDALEKLFHEPNRLSIMSALCAAEAGMTFRELRDSCDLTDGNLNRHLKVLEDASAIRITKEFVDNKPRTTVFVTPTGLDSFQEYLEALAKVLKAARKSIPADQASGLGVAKLARA